MLTELSAYLGTQILGQNHLLERIAWAVIRSELGVVRHAPRMILLGPTGCGKTELAHVLARRVFQAEPLRIDMSETQRPDALELLLGSRAGDTGLLASLVDHQEPRLLLFDEIEKAHPRVLDLFLQILEPGHVTLACGRRLDLSRFLIVATSNIAGAEMVEVQSSSLETLERHVLGQARQTLRPEILNRFDETAVFLPLDYDTQVAVAKLHLDGFLKSLKARGWHVAGSPGVIPFLLQHGFDAHDGARPMKRAIQKHVGNAVARDLLAGGDGCGQLMTDKAHTRLWLQKAEQGGRR